MPDETKKAPEKPKSHAEAKREYDALVRQCADMAARIPKARAEIERQVKAKVGDLEKQLADLKSKKAAAAQEMWAADERERPEREAKAQAEAEALAEQKRLEKAKANERRHAELERAQADRLRAANA